MADREREEDLRRAGRDQPCEKEGPELSGVDAVVGHRGCRDRSRHRKGNDTGDERADLGICSRAQAPAHGDGESPEPGAGERRKQYRSHQSL